MTKRIVTVQYIFEGKHFPHEDSKGVLLPDNKVFVSDEQVGPSLYAATPSDKPDTYVVDLDTSDNLFTDPAMLIDLVVA